jgi:Protein of unknown function (DUF3710)
VRLRRRAEPVQDEDALETDESAADGDGEFGDGPDVRADGPWDSGELPQDGPERIDLGSLLILPEDDRALQIQVDQETNQVQAVLIAGSDGAVELRAFAAPRHGDLWSEARPSIAADMAQSGGTATERQGPFGTELVVQVGTGRGKETQTTRIIGVNGPRWMLRATLYGRPAAEPEVAYDWEDTIRRVAVHRGDHALPPGEALPLSVPSAMQEGQQ